MLGGFKNNQFLRALSRVLERREKLLGLAFDRIFAVFTFITIFLPGGSAYGFNFKYPIYLVLLPLAALRAIRNRRSTPDHFALVLVVPAVTCLWLLLGLLNEFGAAGAFRQFTDMILTFLMCYMASLFCNNEEERRMRFLRLVMNAELATALLKMSLIAYAVLRGIPVVVMVEWLNTVFGVDLMTMDLGALFGRVQFFSDALIPVCIFILLRYRDRLRVGNLRAALTILALLISVLFSFSRYFWGFTAVAFVLGLLLGRRDRFKAVLVGVLGVSILASAPALVVLYQLRFSNAVAGSSDNERTDQIPPLRRLFFEAPLLGHGLGSYTTELLRNPTESGRSSYEVQLLALAAQVGVVGLTLLFCFAAWYYQKLWWKGHLRSADKLSLLVLLACWIAGGLTNPLLFHPIAGVNYATLAALAALHNLSAGAVVPSRSASRGPLSYAFRR